LIQSATSFSFILNFLFFIKVKQIKYIFVFFFLIAVAFIVIFMKFFSENPRFYAEARNMFDKMLNIERKKLAVMQIMDIEAVNKINFYNREEPATNVNYSKDQPNRQNESLASRNSNSNSREDMIFKQALIEKKIKELKVKSEKTRKLSIKKETALKELKGINKQKRKYACPCPCNFFSSFSAANKKSESSDYQQNELVKRNTLLNKKRHTVQSSLLHPNLQLERGGGNSNNNTKISRRHGRISSDISREEINSINKDLIESKYNEDLYIKKYIFTYALVKLSFSMCYISQYFYIHSKITDPNSDNKYRSFFFIFNIFIFSKLAHIFAGYFAFFVNSRTLNIICLIVFGFIMIFVDINITLYSKQRNYYYGQESTFFAATSSYFLRIMGVVMVSVVNSLFEVSVIAYPPTLYRGKVMMKINLLSNFSTLISFIAIFFIDTWAIYIGILALIALFLYFTRLNDCNLEILESNDEAYITQIKMYINKRFSKIENVDKLDGKNF